MAIGTEFFGTDIASFALGDSVVQKIDFGSTTVYELTSAVDNALDLFRAGVAAVDTISLTGLLGEGASGSLDTSVPVGTGTTTSNEDGTTPLANISRWRAGVDHTVVNTFLTNRTPVGSFVLLWVNDQNFALYEVDSHFLDFFEEIDIVSIESMVSVGTTGTGPATMYVFTDTALFLRSVERSLFTDQWQPRAVLADPFVPILATITYGTDGVGISATATGGTGTLNYAWTFEVDGIRFRMDNLSTNTRTTDADYGPPGATTNTDRMSFSGFNKDMRPLFPGHTVSNIGLTMTDDNHDEFFEITDFRTFVGLTNLSHVAYYSNWRDPAFLAGPVSASSTPLGTTVLHWVLGHETDDLTNIVIDFSGSASEFGAYSINGLDNDITTDGSTRLGTITFESVPTVMNSLALFGISFFSIGSEFGSVSDQIAITQIA